jgi:5-formyltetrahydrofolate cyclo-ligase
LSGKRVLREAALAAREAMSGDERTAADQALVALACEVAAGRRVAAYVPLPGEPGGPGLPDALVAVASAVLLPVLRPDRDLDWARYDGTLAQGTKMARLREPAGERLGVDAIAGVDVVLVPALAVDPTGVRLGRGGGSYDRALARVPVGVPVLALLYPDEMAVALPAEPHDHPVTGVLTPDGRR